MEEQKEYEPNFMHIPWLGGQVTAAINIKNEGSEVAYVGLAFCSPVDQFSKRKGRLISAGRLRKDKHFFRLVLNPAKKVSDQVATALEESIKDGNEKLPYWLLGV